MTTGSGVPRASAVRSLNCLTNWPMLTPCWPSAGPTGGAGVACPPGHWSLICAVTCFAMVFPSRTAAVHRRLAVNLLRLLGAGRPRRLADHPLDLARRHRRRRPVDASADEIADAGRLAEEVQDAVVVLHLGHQVARVELALAGDALA